MDVDLGVEDGEEVEWFLGQRIASDIPKPIMMKWGPVLNSEMDIRRTLGPRSEKGIRRQWAYPTAEPPLFHHDLVAALRECGVDNIDVYEALVVDVESGVRCSDYLAINIVGLLRVADMQSSSAVVHSEKGVIDTDFDSLVLDVESIPEVKMFRLAESVNATIVHWSVKKHLETRGGFELTFKKPEDWIG